MGLIEWPDPWTVSEQRMDWYLQDPPGLWTGFWGTPSAPTPDSTYLGVCVTLRSRPSSVFQRETSVRPLRNVTCAYV